MGPNPKPTNVCPAMLLTRRLQELPDVPLPGEHGDFEVVRSALARVEVQKLSLLAGLGLADGRIRPRLQAGDVFAGAPVLPVGQARQLPFPVPDRDRPSEFFVVQ